VSSNLNGDKSGGGLGGSDDDVQGPGASYAKTTLKNVDYFIDQMNNNSTLVQTPKRFNGDATDSRKPSYLRFSTDFKGQNANNVPGSRYGAVDHNE